MVPLSGGLTPLHTYDMTRLEAISTSIPMSLLALQEHSPYDDKNKSWMSIVSVYMAIVNCLELALLRTTYSFIHS